jgi:hypothetical protein
MVDQASLGKKRDPISKLTSSKRAGGMWLKQQGACLASRKPSLNATTAKKKKLNKQNRIKNK